METVKAKPATDRQRALAMYHANLIQQRKDVEAQVLDGMEEMIEFPTEHNASANNPSQADIHQFQKLIQPFQASDYDALIEERNAAEKCGYIFCPKPRPTLTRETMQSHRIVRNVVGGVTKGDLKIVPANQFQTWCSRDCAKRAMFVKVQLSEIPAWERDVGGANQVTLLDESDETPAKSLATTSLDRGYEHRQALADLARERGEQTLLSPSIPVPDASVGMNNSLDETVMKLSIRERLQTTMPHAPNMRDPQAAQDFGTIEGYAPKSKFSKCDAGPAKAQDAENADWDLT